VDGDLAGSDSTFPYTWGWITTTLADGRNLQGIGLFTSDRGSGPLGAYATKNDDVHDNTIVLAPNGGNGITSDFPADYTTNGNRFQNNHYVLCGAAYFAVWNGANGYRYTNPQGWTGAGFDTTGTFTNGC
jgi:hypothetical protein